MQRNLLDLDHYKASIGGLYGNGIAGTLTAYNKQNLNGADLRKSANVQNLINTVLAIKLKPKEAPVLEPEPKTTTDTESQPSTLIEVEPKEKKDFKKETRLSLFGSFMHLEKIPNA